MSMEEGLLDLSHNQIAIVLSAEEAAGAGRIAAAGDGMSAVVSVLEAEAPLNPALVENAAILCLEVRSGSPLSIERIARVRADHPRLPVIALVRDADLVLVRALLRQGVRDVVQLPLSPSQLTESISETLAEMKTSAPMHVRHGRLISVVKSIGGVGATNVAVNLASALAQQDGASACLFDLDVQFGNAATYLGAPAQPSLTDLLDGGARVDGDFLNTVTAKLPSGLGFVPAPQDIGPLEAIDDIQLQRILQTARGEFDYVVADMPANWANWTLSAVARSDLIVLVVNLTIASLRQGKRQLQLLLGQGIERSRIVVLANRIEQRLFKPIDLEDAGKALGFPITLSVHNDYALMSAANNQGVIAGDFNRKAKVSRDFVRIAESVSSMLPRKE